MNLVLVGVRAAGKTAVGTCLAERLGYDLVDLDELVGRRAGRPVATILTVDGEPVLRALERQALETLTTRDRMVLAAGGGTVERAEGRRLLTSLGPVVWLRTTPEEAVRRSRSGGTRPPLTALDPLGEARAVAARRAPLYRAIAAFEVETNGRSLEEICTEVERRWHAAVAADRR